MLPSTLIARLGALCYIAWGLFHVNVAHDIYTLGSAQTGIAQGRLYQLAAYMLCIAVFAILTAAVGNWRNGERSYWLNLIVVGWADLVWVLVVVLPGYVPLLRGLLPPTIYVLGALLTTAAKDRSARIFDRQIFAADRHTCQEGGQKPERTMQADPLGQEANDGRPRQHARVTRRGEGSNG